MRLLHHVHIHGRFNDTQQARITPNGQAAFADLGFSECVATLAMSQCVERMLQGIGHALRTRPIPLHQIISHALRRFWTDTRQAAQCLNQGFEA